MTKSYQQRLVFHSSIILFVGLGCGILALPEEFTGNTFQGWRNAQVVLLASGLWILAMASTLPLLRLLEREALTLFWSLVASGYGFLLASSIEAITGMRAVSADGPGLLAVGFAGNLLGLLGASVGVLLTLMGVHQALREDEETASSHHFHRIDLGTCRATPAQTDQV